MIFVTELKCQKHDHEEAQQPTLVCGVLVSLLGSFGELQSVVGLVGWLVWLLHFVGAFWFLFFSWLMDRDNRGLASHAFSS